MGPLAIRGLEFRSQNFELVLPSGDLQWTPSALLRGALAVERLAVEGLRYTQRTVPEVAEKRAPVSLPERLELPFAIRVQAISLRDLQIQATPDGEPLVIGEADFTAKYDRSGETQVALRVEAPVISLSGEIDIVTVHGPETYQQAYIEVSHSTHHNIAF
jgi:autotransporter translocation and assembly factor TamB